MVRSRAPSLSDRLRISLRLLRSPLPAAPSASLTVRFPLRCGEGCRLSHVPHECPCGWGLASPPVGHHLRQASEERLVLPTCLLAPAAQHLWLVIVTDV